MWVLKEGLIMNTTFCAAIIAAATLVSLTFEAIAQEKPTIPEIVTSGGGWGPPSPPSGAGPSLSTILSKTQLVVRGTIAALGVRPSNRRVGHRPSDK
jgi:hypothetical protein